MATITPGSPDGTATEEVDADHVSDSGTVHAVRVRLEDESFVHPPYARLYEIRTSEAEGRVDYSSA